MRSINSISLICLVDLIDRSIRFSRFAAGVLPWGLGAAREITICARKAFVAVNFRHHTSYTTATGNSYKTAGKYL